MKRLVDHHQQLILFVLIWRYQKVFALQFNLQSISPTLIQLTNLTTNYIYKYIYNGFVLIGAQETKTSLSHLVINSVREQHFLTVIISHH